MNNKLTTPFVPISWGELIDKLTILEIKESKIDSLKAKENINKELKLLLDIASIESLPNEVRLLKQELMRINLMLWEVEDSIREKEFENQFDIAFIELARSVYKFNDLRAKTKQSINLLLNSELVEEKSYKNFH
jgi:hypothetical protein